MQAGNHFSEFIVMGNAEDEENISKSRSAPIERNSYQCRITRVVSKEKVVSPRGSRSVKVRDKGGLLKSEKSGEQNDYHLCASRTGKVNGDGSLRHRKPWPSRKATGVDEEMVKHMSNIPSYLQRIERGDNCQDKALNFGVIDWERLERWAHNQKQGSNMRVGCSPPICNRPSSFSAVESLSNGSPFTERKKVPLNDNFDPSSKRRHQTKMREEDSTRHVDKFSDSIRHHRTSEKDYSIGIDRFEDQCKKGKRRDTRSISYKIAESPDIGTSDPNIKAGDSIDLSGYLPHDEHSVSSKDIEGIWDHLEGSVSGRHSSVESTIFDSERAATGVLCNSFSVNSPEDFRFPDISCIPHSCPLPSAIRSEFSAAASTIQSEIGGPKAKAENHNQSSDEFVGRKEAKSSDTIRRELSTSHCSRSGLIWMKRSSSSREASSTEQMKCTVSATDSSHGDKAASNGRRSPLRRILDPLLKSKNRTISSRPIAASSIDDAHDLRISNRHQMQLSDPTLNSSTSPETGNLNSSNQKQKNMLPTTRQALLQVTFKNGTPLLMFSSNGNNILAATMRKKNVSDNDNVECIYTILSINEVKKKSGVWIKQMNRSRDHGLVSFVVGQLNVSNSDHDSKGIHVAKEFVLLGSELVPADLEPVNPVFKSELAAIIVKIPKGTRECTVDDALKSEDGRDSWPTNSAEGKVPGFRARSLPIEHLSSTVALLPSTVHGISATAEPSPLIERWKSGGICDCGGWDEGCMLTVLTDSLQGSKSSGEVQASKDTFKFQLFVQGGTEEKNHAFSMIACNEGLYTIEFKASIALLQAFAICIAALHGRNPKSLHDSIVASNTRTAPTSYVPNRPPVSPVGRA